MSPHLSLFKTYHSETTMETNNKHQTRHLEQLADRQVDFIVVSQNVLRFTYPTELNQDESLVRAEDEEKISSYVVLVILAVSACSFFDPCAILTTYRPPLPAFCSVMTLESLEVPSRWSGTISVTSYHTRRRRSLPQGPPLEPSLVPLYSVQWLIDSVERTACSSLTCCE